MKIINIDANPKFYFGGISKKDINFLIEQYKKTGNIEKIISGYCQKTNNNYFKNYVLNKNRALCLSMFKDIHNFNVLDYGCGFGTIGIMASIAGAKVTYIDSCLKRLEIVKMRCQDNKINNAKIIAIKSWKSLKSFKTKYDLIILNGILEWIPTTEHCFFSDVQIEQVKFLEYMGNLLNPNGHIYIGIENRYSLKYYFGYPEDHTNIRFLSLIPRSIANIVHKILRGNDYTNWTWSIKEYNKIIPTIGLKIENINTLFPDYRFPKKIVPLWNEKKIFVEMKKDMMNSVFQYKLKILKYLFHTHTLYNHVYSLGIVLMKQ